MPDTVPLPTDHTGSARPELARAKKISRLLATRAAEVLEVDLVVLDPADREGELELQRAQLRVDLVRRGEVDSGELAEDLVALRDVALVEPVVRLNLDRLVSMAIFALEPYYDDALDRVRRDLLDYCTGTLSTST